MFESVYGMSHQSFAATPNPQCCAAVKSMGNAYKTLEECLISGQGIGILTGFSGLGKSLLCRTLALSLSHSYHAINLHHSNFKSSRDMLQAILYELGMPFKDMTEQELRLDITQALISIIDIKKKGSILLIDEADNLSEELLEEIRSLSNMTLLGIPLIRIVLSGQMELEENLMSPSLSEFQQRIGCQVSLESLNRQETIDYIQFRVEWAGGKLEEVFTASALEFIAQVCDGNPRCINAICEHSLTHGAQLGEKPIDITAVMQAFEQLKQLPLRWNDPQQVVYENDIDLDDFEEMASDFDNISNSDTNSSIIDLESSSGSSNTFEVGADNEIDCDVEINCDVEMESHREPEQSFKEFSSNEQSGVAVFEVGAESETFECNDDKIAEETDESVEFIDIIEIEDRDLDLEKRLEDSLCQGDPSSSFENDEGVANYEVDSDFSVFDTKDEIMHENKVIKSIDTDYCVPDGDGWSTFDPNTKLNPLQIIEKMESALEYVFCEENIEDTKPEIHSIEKKSLVNGFEEEIIMDQYAVLDANQDMVVNNENIDLTDSIESENFSSNSDQSSRLDPAELKRAIHNRKFDVILPEGQHSSDPSVKMNQPKYLSKKHKRQDV